MDFRSSTDRVTLLVVVRNGGDSRFIVLAAAEREGDADERATEADGALSSLG